MTTKAEPGLSAKPGQQAPESESDFGDSNAGQVQTLFLVAGMHRSGTSAVAGTLTCIGVAPPRHLIGPSDNNAKGYWESPVVRDLNDEILAAAGLRWDDIHGIPPAWFDGAGARPFRQRIEHVFAQEFGTAERAVVKDPRLCRLLPMWTSALSNRADVRVIIPFRNPMEVASSLERRSQIPKQYGLLLWLRHVLAAERDSRALSRSFVAFDALLADWRREMTRLGSELGVEWARLSAPVEARVEEFLSPGLRHHTLSAGELPTGVVPETVRRCYEALITHCVDQPHGAWESSFDELRAELDDAGALLGPALEAIRHRKAPTPRRSHVAFEAELSQLRTSLLAAETRRNELADSRSRLEAEKARLTAEVARLRSDDEQQREQLTRFRKAQFSLEERVAGLEAENEWLQDSLRARFDELALLEKRLAKTETKLETTERTLEQKRRKLAAKSNPRGKKRGAKKRANGDGSEERVPEHHRMVDVARMGARVRKLVRDPQRFLQDSRHPLLSRLGKRFPW